MKRRFVVQRHTVATDDVHYDLMIEAGDVLVTIQLNQEPSAGALGRRSFDHRPKYLEFEGEISRGRGTVAIWDRGELEDKSGDPRSGAYTALFSGERLAGLYTLTDSGEAVALKRC